MQRFTMLLVLAILSTNGCQQLTTAVDGGTASGTVCFWISATKDAHVSYGRTGEEVDQNFGLNGSLVVAVGPIARKRSYVDFSLPTFPAGTEVQAAKLELYHSGKNEDGYTDDITMNVARIPSGETWTPAAITWNNRPDRGGNFAPETSIPLRSQNWSGTPDIAGYVREMIANSSAYNGFVIWLDDGSFPQQVEKGFYSDNDIRRKQNDLGLAPRLLVRVKLPDGKSTDDITLPFLPSGHDLQNLPQPVTTLRFTRSDSWPTEWNVSPN
jgi:hypothetical protein